MTKVIYYTATTFNGIVGDDRKSVEWLSSVDDQIVNDHDEFIASIGALVQGRTTYTSTLETGDILANPSRWQDLFGERPSYVFTTRTDLPVPEGADVRFARGTLADTLPELLAAADGKDVWLQGGGELAGQFLDEDALDEIVLSYAPVGLAGGAPVFPREISSERLKLVSADKRGNFIRAVYSVGRP